MHLLQRLTRALRSNVRAAIDLASIMVGVLVIGLIAGVISATVFAVIPWAQDRAAASELDAVRTAESVHRTKDGAYATVPGLTAAGYLQATTTVAATPGDNCYVAVTRSRSGKVLWLDSKNPAPQDYVPGSSSSPCADVTATASAFLRSGPGGTTPVVNLASNPSFEDTAGTATYRTNLIRNPSFETSVTGWTGVRADVASARVSVPFMSGGNRANVTVTELGFMPRLVSAQIPAAPAETFTVSFTKPTTTGHGQDTRVGIQFFNAAAEALDIRYGNYANVGGDRSSLTTVAPAGTASLYVWVGVPDNTPVGTMFYVDSVLLERSISVGTYFDGSTPPVDADVTASWTGTPHQSESVLTGKQVSAHGNRTAPIQSGMWAGTGTKSLRLAAVNTLNPDAYVSVLEQVGTLKPNTTYTFAATAHLTSKQEGSLTGNGARGLFVHLNGRDIVGGMRGHTPEIQAANTPGTTRLVATFTTPDVLTGYNTVRLYNGGLAGTADVFWDDLLFVEGTHDGTYFDGGSAGGTWLGEPHKSASIRF